MSLSPVFLLHGVSKGASDCLVLMVLDLALAEFIVRLASILLLHGVSQCSSDGLILMVNCWALAKFILLLACVFLLHSLAKTTSYGLILVVHCWFLAKLIALACILLLHCIPKCSSNRSILWTLILLLVLWHLRGSHHLGLRRWSSLKRVIEVILSLDLRLTHLRGWLSVLHRSRSLELSLWSWGLVLMWLGLILHLR